MNNDNFSFDLNAKVTRKSDHDLLTAAEEYAKVVGFRYFGRSEFDKWAGRRCQSRTISARFGSWKKALAIIGIEGGREYEYTPDELIENLEVIWKKVGRPPGQRQVGQMGAKISWTPYKRIWGSVRKACEFIARFHRGEITREQLLAGSVNAVPRKKVPLDVRWNVLKRDNYCCVTCGASPAVDHSIRLEVDHIVPVAKGGTNDFSNLRTLCVNCNAGKSDR
jgi:hypothetical protein